MKDKYTEKTLAESAIDLLYELTKICDDNNLDYYLSPAMVKRAQEGLDYNTFFMLPEIYMRASDILKLISVVKTDTQKTRGIDCLVTNSGYTCFDLSYVNENTTYILISRGADFSLHGIRVVIQAICDDVIGRMPLFAESWLDENSYAYIKSGNKRENAKRELLKRLFWTIKTIAPGEFNRKLFLYLANQYGSNPNSKRVFVKPYGQKRIYYSRKIFDEKTSMDFCGKTFTVPKKIDPYLKSFYGPGVKLLKAKPFNNLGVLISTTVPFREFIDRMENDEMSISDLFEDYKKLRLENSESENIRNAVDRVFVVAQMSRDRKVFHEALSNNIDKIRHMREAKDFKGLGKLFAKYEKRTRYYIEQGLTLCPDGELFDIMCEILEEKGDHDIVKNLRRHLAEHQRTPLTCKKQRN